MPSAGFQRIGAALQRCGVAQRGIGQLPVAFGAHDAVIRLVRQGFLAPLVEQRLRRPVRIGRHEGGDLVHPCRVGCQQPVIGDQLGRDRIGIAGCGRLGIGPTFRAHEGYGILGGGRKGRQQEQQEGDETDHAIY